MIAKLNPEEHHQVIQRKKRGTWEKLNRMIRNRRKIRGEGEDVHFPHVTREVNSN